MIRLLIAIAIVLGAGPALAQGNAGRPAQAEAPGWTRSDGRLRFAPAAVTLPARAAGVQVTEVREFSHPGENIDNIVQYRSSDGAVIGTVYIYYPALAHTGLAAFATDNAIRINSPTNVSTRGSSVVAAGRFPGAALRADYGNYRNGNASSAAFIKVGRWMIKLRVSAPEQRRGEVEAAMTALLSQIGFEGEQPSPASAMDFDRCPDAPERDARLLPDDMTATFTDSLLGVIDGAGSDEAVRSRVPRRWCRSALARIGDGQYPILRALPEQSEGEETSRLAVIISDAGGLLEVVAAPGGGRYTVLHHQIGETAVLGSFDAVPSNAQIAAIISGSDTGAARLRARIRLRPGEGSDLQLFVEPTTQAPEPVT
ncbi:MAG: hypothetical protein M3177_06740 [Pseudomonadota bacterium]|nr:hypothetical protein [Pseudomonadota bacterium]